jgi:hypothetical protein
MVGRGFYARVAGLIAAMMLWAGAEGAAPATPVANETGAGPVPPVVREGAVAPDVPSVFDVPGLPRQTPAGVPAQAASKPKDLPPKKRVAPPAKVAPAKPDAEKPAAEKPEAEKNPVRDLPPNFNTPCRFVTSLCAAGDALWVGTEGDGLWRVDLAGNPARREAWWQVNLNQVPLPVNVYGVAVDVQGRVWFGTAGQGVAVFNGSSWRPYGVIEGCGGQRVFCIAADRNPDRGHVWIGTEHGLTRYTAEGGENGSWFTYTRLHGLPSDQVTAVCVSEEGRVWVGTECDGLAWSDPPYVKFTPVTKAGPAPKNLKIEVKPGLGCDRINAVAVLPDGTVAAGTTDGVLLGLDKGTSWVLWQGLDGQPHNNYVCGLAADGKSGLWIASRVRGLAHVDLATGRLMSWARKAPAGRGAINGEAAPWVQENYLRALALGDDGGVWTGCYGEGVGRVAVSDPVGLAPASPRAQEPVQTDPGPASMATAELPNPEPIPTDDDLRDAVAYLRSVPSVANAKLPGVVRCGDDWLTRGDWRGRYGRYWAVLCGQTREDDGYEWGGGPEKVEHQARVGAPAPGGAPISTYVYWLSTDNPGALEMPPTYAMSRVVKGYQAWDAPRRQSEWTDHGEGHPLAESGPDLYCTLKIPAGLYTLSLYFNNRNAHVWDCALRDYRVSIRRAPAQAAERPDFEKWPELARARVTDHALGVYKKFLVRGPDEIVVRVSRNHSVNTHLEGVMLDALEELPVPYAMDAAAWKKLLAERDALRRKLLEDQPPPVEGKDPPPMPRAVLGNDLAGAMLEELDRVQLRNPEWWAANARPAYAALARRYLSLQGEEVAETPEQKQFYRRMATCLYHLGLYVRWEAALTRARQTSPREIENAIRWDGKTDCGGRGYEVIRAHLEGKPVAPSPTPAPPVSDTRPPAGNP